MTVGPTIYRKPKRAFILERPKGNDKVKWNKHRNKKKLPTKLK